MSHTMLATMATIASVEDILVHAIMGTCLTESTWYMSPTKS